MMHLKRFTSLFTVVLGLTASSAFADSFTYSYSFVGNYDPAYSGAGHTVTGTFDGTAAGNLITGITNATVNLDGNPILAGTVYAQGVTTSGWTAGAAVISFDGLQNDFAFFDLDYAGGLGFTKYFLGVSGAPFWPGLSEFDLFDASGLPEGRNLFLDYYNGSPSYSTPNGSWTVTDVSAVPDTGATIALLGSALLGLAAIRRRFLA